MLIFLDWQKDARNGIHNGLVIIENSVISITGKHDSVSHVMLNSNPCGGIFSLYLPTIKYPNTLFDRSSVI